MSIFLQMNMEYNILMIKKLIPSIIENQND